MKSFDCIDCLMVDRKYLSFDICRLCKRMLEQTYQAPLEYGFDPCARCPNLPKNGGSGICNCTIGGSKISY